MTKRKWGAWTEHFNAKKNKYYYYNAETKESTYTIPKGFNENAQSDQPPAKRKKVTSTEKQAESASGSNWQRGFSTKQGKNFWYNRVTKKYVYTEPNLLSQEDEPCPLMLSGFPPETTKEKLNSILGTRGEIVRLDIVENRGYGFVVYKDPEVAKQFKKECETTPLLINGQEVLISKVNEDLKSKSGLGADVTGGWGEQNDTSTWGRAPQRSQAASGGRGGYGYGRR